MGIVTLFSMHEIDSTRLQRDLAPVMPQANYDVAHGRHTGDFSAGKSLIHNIPFLFSCDEAEKMQVYANYSLVIEGDTIAAAGPAEQFKPEDFAAVYDASKRGGIVVTPGFINTHSHPPMYLMRSAMMLDEGEGIDETIAAMPMWEREMDTLDYTVATIGDITEQQKHGITSVLSHYGTFEPIEYAARLTAQNILNAVSAVSNSHPENTPEMLEGLLARQGEFTSRIGAAIHYLYKATPETLKKIQALVEHYDTLFTCHFAESPMVEQECINRLGMREVDALDTFGLLNDRTVISHAIYVNEPEIRRLVAARVGISHLPTSNVIHKSGTFPLWKFADVDGLPQVTLGTDGVVSKSRLDLLTEAYQTRLTHLYDRTVKFSSLFKMMTVNGARVLHMPDRGRLLPGFKADIAFWKLKDRGFIPYNEKDPMTLLGNIITHGGRTVRDLMVNGRFIIQNRRHVLIDESKLLEQLQVHHMEMRRRVEKN